MQEQLIPYGYCHCGCGEKANIADRTRPKQGLVKGEPRRFVRGHQWRTYQRPGPDYVVDPITGCWIWQRSKVKGYGQMAVKRKPCLAHRWYYEQKHGPLNGQHLDHLCRTPACVNPDHLEPVTIRENTRRGDSALLTPAQVREIRDAPRGYGTGRALARKYGVTNATISDIRNRRTWADL